MLAGIRPSLPWLKTATGNGPLPSGTSQKPASSRPSLGYDVRHCSYGCSFSALAGMAPPNSGD
jgi:hypothetical protein